MGRNDLQDETALALGGYAREPRLFTDAPLLGALHAELEARAPDEAERALFELGLLHGLRDASAALASGVAADPAVTTTDGRVAAPALLVALGPRPRGLARGELGLVGRWPARHEAHARVSRLGASHGPSCHVSAGYTSGWYAGLLERDVLALERSCVACGDAACSFELRDLEDWRERDEPRAAVLLAGVSWEGLRALVARERTRSAARRSDPVARPGGGSGAGPDAGSGTGPDAGSDAGQEPVVHVWGPVMVMPFHGVDTALRALDLIGRDPAAREVSVVVVDLTDAVLDEAFGAATLEHVLAAVEGWGAEAVLAGVSPLSEAVVADLARDHVIVHKDLPHAIAAAFQIARSQWKTV